MQSSLPQVSIITPAYNAAYCIENALKYALAQTYASWDMIVVNDGSTDNTAEIVQSYADKHPNIKLHTLPRNRGVFYARNFGVTLASEFVVFLDADDELTPTAIEEAVKAQQEHDVDIVHFTYAVLVEEAGQRVLLRDMSQIIGTKRLIGDETIQAYSKVNCIIFTMWSKLFRRTVLEHAVRKLNIVAANRLTYAEDLLFQSAMLTSNLSMVGISNIGYIYHINASSLTNSKSNEEKEFAKYFTLNYTKRLSKYNVLEIQQKTGIQLDMYLPSENWFKVKDVERFESMRRQIQIIQIWTGVGMFNKGEEHIKRLQQSWEEKVFSRCTFQNGGWLQNDGSEFILPDEVLGSGFVELWNGQNSEEIFCKGLSLKQTFELIDHIWEQRESGVDVQKETENSYGGWYNNYLKATGGI
ncbi:Glycosyl_transferase family 2 protein [Hexamita inflata]|uniref:Glycosyl transferase family 2 protein n=1 Tax=Hexamita inflata TaxID=28002 RepID=A0AA86QYU9_9EUKA|nr:Glycosyl transferase family 2 protein [Hexamita inflata]